MFKKIVLFAILIIPVMTFAQETQKIAYVNHDEVFTAMPEVRQASDSLTKVGESFQAELKTMSDEYEKKFTDFIEQQETLSEAIKIRRQADLNDLRERTNNFQQYAGQKIQELEQALVVPIQEKLKKAINDVGKENNFLYIADSRVLLYISTNAVDATPLVKKKLGIQ